MPTLSFAVCDGQQSLILALLEMTGLFPQLTISILFTVVLMKR
ncbi:MULTISPECIES: hypothetical protein [unclassified Bartonella]